MRQLLLAVAAVVCVLAAAHAQVPDASWKDFVQYSKYRTPNNALGFDDHLYRAARYNRSQGEAVAEFSARIGVSPEVGAVGTSSSCPATRSTTRSNDWRRSRRASC
jgi:hypothetical protein